MKQAVLLILALAPQDEGKIRQWIRDLAHDDPDVRVRSEQRLTDTGMEASPLLNRHVDDPDLERRARVRRILSVLRLVEETKFLTGPAVEERAELLEALGRRHNRDPFEVLKQDPDRRHVPALTDVILFEFDPDRRAGAVEALLAIGTPETYPALLWSLRYPPDRGERVIAWLALHGDLTLVDELERMGRAKMMRAMVVLRAIRMRHPGEQALKPVEWKPIEAGPVLFAAGKGTSIAQRARGLRAIATGLSSDVRGLRLLRGALEGREEELRFRAAEAFTQISWGEAVDALVRRLGDPKESLRVRRMCGVALARNGSMTAKTSLLDALKTGSVEIRVAAADALGKTGDVTLAGLAEKTLGEQTEPRVVEALKRAVRTLRGR